MNFSLDTVIFIIYLFCDIALYVILSKAISKTGNAPSQKGALETSILISSIISSWIGGQYIFITMDQIYSSGFYYVVACLGLVVCLLLNIFVLIPRMGEFLGNISVADSMGHLYGKNVQIISSISGLIATTGLVALQIKIFGIILKIYYNMSNEYAIFLAGSILVIKPILREAGPKSFSNITQFFSFGVIIPIVTMIIWYKFTNINGINSLEDISGFIFFNDKIMVGDSRFWVLISLFFIFSLSNFSPTIFQKLIISNNIPQVKRAFTTSFILLFLVLCSISWISFLLFNIEPNLNLEALLSKASIDNTHTWIKGFVLVAITSICIANADAQLNTSSILFINDFLCCLKVRDIGKLILSKIIVLVIGLLGVYLTLLNDNLLSLLFLTQSFYIPIVVVPLIFGILGFRSTTMSVLIGMFAGFVCTISWRIFFMNVINIDAVILGTVANLIFFILSHYLLNQKGGWVGIKDKVPLTNFRLARRLQYSKLIELIKNFHILDFVRNNAPKNELTYAGFGVFCIISTICTIFSMSDITEDYEIRLLFLYGTMLILPVSFFTYRFWPPIIKKDIIIQILWNITIFYLLIICSSFFLMLNNFDHLQFVTFTVNLVVVAILTRWKIALSMIITGVYISVQYYKYYTGLQNIDISLDSFIFYSLLLISVTVIIFLKPQQEKQELTEEKEQHLIEKFNAREEELKKLVNLKYEFLRNISHEVHAPITGITKLGESLGEVYDKLNDEQRRQTVEVIAKSSEKLIGLTNNILDLSKLSSLQYELRINNVNLSQLTRDRLEVCKRLYLGRKVLEFVTNIEQNIIITCDEYYIKQVLDNLIINAINYSDEGRIILKLKRIENGVEFAVYDRGVSLSNEELLDIFGTLVINFQSNVLKDARGVGLVLCKKVIELHKGRIWAENNVRGIGTIFKFVLLNK